MSDLAGTTEPWPRDDQRGDSREDPIEDPRDDGLWSAGRRSLTIGLILNVTIVASEALAVSTIMPIVARDLGGIDLYGWVFSGFFLGSLLGIVVAGMLIDRGSLARPFVLGIGLFAIGLLVGVFLGAFQFDDPLRQRRLAAGVMLTDARQNPHQR